LLRPGEITVQVGPQHRPAAGDFHAALALRNAARAWMLEHRGEPDLGIEESARATGRTAMAARPLAADGGAARQRRAFHLGFSSA
jgi:hypothetical protein